WCKSKNLEEDPLALFEKLRLRFCRQAANSIHMLGKVNRLSPALSYTVIEMKNGMKMQLCVVRSVADRAISRVQIRCINDITGTHLREESSTQAMLLENVHDEWNAVTLRPDEAHDGAVRADRSPAGVFPGTAQGTFRINRNVNVDDGGYLVTSA